MSSSFNFKINIMTEEKVEEGTNVSETETVEDESSEKAPVEEGVDEEEAEKSAE